MTKNVWVTIHSLQMLDGEAAEPMEIVSAGEYYYRNGKHYILYDELMEGFEEITKNKIKIAEDRIDITKKGVTNVEMQFERGKCNDASYQTPYGPILVGMQAHRMDVDAQENNLHVQLDYTLSSNGLAVAECNISIDVRPRQTSAL